MKDIYDTPYQVAGILAQTAADAVKAKIAKIADKTSEDAAFFQTRLTLEFSILSYDFGKIVQTIRVSETFNWNLPDHSGESNEKVE